MLLPQERFVIQVTDLLTVSMMLGITAQVKEAGIAWDKGEKKSKHCFFYLALVLMCHKPGYCLEVSYWLIGDDMWQVQWFENGF